MNSILANLAAAQVGLVNLVNQTHTVEPTVLYNLSIAQAGLVAVAQQMMLASQASQATGADMLEPAMFAVTNTPNATEVSPVEEPTVVQPVAPVVQPATKPKRKYTRRVSSKRSDTSSSSSEPEPVPDVVLENFTTQFMEIPQHQKDAVCALDNPRFDPCEIAVLVHDNPEHPEQRNIYVHKGQVYTYCHGRWLTQDCDDHFITELIRKMASLYYMREDRQTRTVTARSGVVYTEIGQIINEMKNDKECELYNEWVEHASKLKRLLQTFYKR